MFRNYINVALRNLVKHKLYSAINIIGLAVGLAACILIMLFVRDELSYDKFWKDADQIQRLHTTFNIPGREPFVTVVAMGPAKAALAQYFKEEISHTTRFNGMRVVLKYNDKVFNERIHWTDPETAEMFDFKVVAGDLQATLDDKASIAINKSFAKKYFGGMDPIGQVFTVTVQELKRDYRVGAVYEDIPNNSVLNMQAMVKIDEKDFENQTWLFTQWFSVNNNIFYKLKDGVDPQRVRGRLDDFTNKIIPFDGGAFGAKDSIASDFLSLTSLNLPDIQLTPSGLGEMKPTGSMTNVLIFSAIAGLILVIACINFMNLATAKSTQRAREVALRKVLGAERKQLVFQFLGESILLAVIGLLIGIVLVELFLPFYNDFLGKSLEFIYSDPMTIGVLVGLIATIGLVGGVYPALVLSGFRPAYVLKANKSAENSGSVALRSILVIFQFAVSISLIIGASVVYGQKIYATSMDPGFNKDNLLIVRGTSRQGINDNQAALKQQIQKLPNAVSVTFGGDTPSNGNENNTSITIPRAEVSQSLLIGQQTVDYEYFETYGINFLSGRDYSRDFARDALPSTRDVKEGTVLESNIIVNESALGRFGFGSPTEALGKVIAMGRGNNNISSHLKIVGVVTDTHFQSLRTVVRPEIYILRENNQQNLTIRYSGSPIEMVEGVKEIWQSLAPDVPFRHQFVDEAMAEEFTEETSIAQMLGVFSSLAVIVACLGLYGLASFTAERRTKEIGVRKIMGARVRDIVGLLVWQFSKPVLIANLIAWPLTAWGMLTWLENFPNRLEAIWLLPICIMAGLVALIIAWGTVGGNAAKVARSNPIKALRYE